MSDERLALVLAAHPDVAALCAQINELADKTNEQLDALKEQAKLIAAEARTEKNRLWGLVHQRVAELNPSLPADFGTNPDGYNLSMIYPDCLLYNKIDPETKDDAKQTFVDALLSAAGVQ